jgi:DNA repair exonuclease SbcCD ATPase subunit
MRYIKEHKNETDNLIYTGGLDFFRRLKQVLEVKVADTSDSDDSKELSDAKELYELCNEEFNDKLSMFTEKLTEYNKGIGETFKKQTEGFTVTTNGIYELKKKLSEIKAELAGAESKINLDFIIKFNELKNSLDEVIKAISDVEESKKQLDEAMADKFKEERDKFMEQYEVPKAPDIEIPEAVLKNLDADDVYIVTDDTCSLVALGKEKRIKIFENHSNKPEIYTDAFSAYGRIFDKVKCKSYNDTFNIFILTI